MALSDSFRSLLERSPASVLEEQIRKLYMRLYPFFTRDFVHLQDMRITLAQLSAQVTELQAAMILHTHVSAAPGQPTSPGIAVVTNVVPANLNTAVAESLIVPGGVPQPTGEGVAQVASRIGPPSEIVAIPPLDPASLV